MTEPNHLHRPLARESWRSQAACLGEDINLFFPPKERYEHHAKDICARCPVRLACLDWALGNHIEHGVYGGAGEAERRRMRRRRAS